jgi:hypothetical protein
MIIIDLGYRVTPEPRAEGDKIHWKAPGLSRRMLENHLSQDNDWASRHVAFLHNCILAVSPDRNLGRARVTHAVGRAPSRVPCGE